MSFSYLENEFGLSFIISDLNNRLERINQNTRLEKVIGEVENIVLKEVSMSIIPPVDNYDDINIFTHRFAITFYGQSKGKYFNLITLHSKDIFKEDYKTFFPDDFEIRYEEEGINIESKYILSEEKNEVLSALSRIKYKMIFETEFLEKVITVFDKIGYKAENDLS